MHSVLSSLLFLYKSLVIFKTTHLVCVLRIQLYIDMDYDRRNNCHSSQRTSRPANALKRVVVIVSCYSINKYIKKAPGLIKLYLN